MGKAVFGDLRKLRDVVRDPGDRYWGQTAGLAATLTAFLGVDRELDASRHGARELEFVVGKLAGHGGSRDTRRAVAFLAAMVQSFARARVTSYRRGSRPRRKEEHLP